MSAQPRLTVEYLEPVEVEVEAEPLPDEAREKPHDGSSN
jgi:hypothetical protein